MGGGGDIPVPTPIVVDGPDLHHERARPARAHLRHPHRCRRRHHAEGRQAIGADGVDAEPRGRLHADAAGLRRPALQLPRQRRAERLRRQDRRAEVPAAARRGQDGLHRVAGGGRRQDLLHQRGRRHLRRQGRADVRAARRRTRWAKCAWRRRRSRKACCSSGRAATWWRSASVRRGRTTTSAAATTTTTASSASSSGFAFDSIQIATAAAPSGMTAGTENAPAG